MLGVWHLEISFATSKFKLIKLWYGCRTCWAIRYTEGVYLEYDTKNFCICFTLLYWSSPLTQTRKVPSPSIISSNSRRSLWFHFHFATLLCNYTANSLFCDFFFAGMAKVLGFLVLALSVLICEAAIFKPISESHRSAALELFTPAHGSLSRFD